MKISPFKKYYLGSLLCVLALSFYPLYMGVRILAALIRNGFVSAESYPKYVIPYTPISIAVILCVLCMPLIMRFAKRFAPLVSCLLGTGVFFAAELWFENVMIQNTVTETVYKNVYLGDWQMYMCAVPPQYYVETETRTYTEIDLLIGNYSPAFKIHFYIISIVLILAFLNCFYGFAHIIISADKQRFKSLLLQSVSAVLFLALCILACFTAFFRTGTIRISPLSATLMTVFFVVFGITMGIFVGSFLTKRRRRTSVWICAVTASVTTFIMYIGEMILLGGKLYRFGNGLMFDGLRKIVFSPFDILTILLSGAITAGIFILIMQKYPQHTAT